MKKILSLIFVFAFVFIFGAINTVAEENPVLMTVVAKTDQRIGSKSYEMVAGFMNTDTREKTTITLRPENKYSGKVKLSPGKYRLVSLYVDGPWDASYGFSPIDEFEVSGQAMTFNFTVGNGDWDGKLSDEIDGFIDTEKTNEIQVENNGKEIDWETVEEKSEDFFAENNSEENNGSETVENTENNTENDTDKNAENNTEDKKNDKKTDKKSVIISVIFTVGVFAAIIVILILRKRHQGFGE